MKKLKRRVTRVMVLLLVIEAIVFALMDHGTLKTTLMCVILVAGLAELFRVVRKTHQFRFEFSPKPVKSSAIVTRYLEKLHGIEIGASTQNSYQLKRAINVDFADDPGIWQESYYEPATIHIVSDGDDLPFKSDTLEYVLSSHNIEHYFDPIKALREWWRVVKPGGYIVLIVPHKDRTFDSDREETTLEELKSRNAGELTIRDYICKRVRVDADGHELSPGDQPVPEGWMRLEQDDHHHWSVWKTESFLELCNYLNFPVVEYQDRDDKIGNGFTVVIQKPAPQRESE